MVNCRWFASFPSPNRCISLRENKTLNMIRKFLLVPSTMLSLRRKVVKLVIVRIVRLWSLI